MFSQQKLQALTFRIYGQKKVKSLNCFVYIAATYAVFDQWEARRRGIDQWEIGWFTGGL